MFRVATVYAAAAFVVVQAADLIVGPLRLPEWTMPLIIVLALVGFPVALVLAWALELTPEGVRRTAPSRIAGTVARTRVVMATIAATVLLFAGAGSLYVVRRSAEAEVPRSIAVLPFADMSEAGNQRYFSSGLSEELTAALSRVEGLHVAARTAAFQFTEEGADLAEVGHRLRVSSVLEGSVRREGDRLRVTVRLVDVSTGYERWTEVFDRRVDDVFAVQEEIAREVLSALRFDEAGRQIVRPGTDDLAAYDHLLRGNYHLARRTPDDVQRAIQFYRAALDADPQLAVALFREAYAWLLFIDWGWEHPERSADEVLAVARERVERGMSLAPSSAEGWLARGYLYVAEDPYAMAGALHAFERSLALEPGSAEAWHQYGQSLMVLGRYDDASEAYRRALRLEPDRAMTMVPMAAIAQFTGRTAEASRWADSAVATQPANSYARASRARTLLAAGQVEAALAEARLAAGLDNAHAIPVATTLAVALAADGDRAGAKRVLDEALGTAGTGELSAANAAYLAMAAGALDETDLALRLLRRAEPKGAWFWFHLQSPLFDRLRDDAGFRQLVSEADHRRVAG